MKYFKQMILICLVACLTGCQSASKTDPENKKDHTAVLYFSVTGHTQKIAEYIADITDASLIEIQPEKPYSDADIDYNNDNSRANLEQNDSTARPTIENNLNIENYDVIYLGYPIWWGKEPKIILTLLDDYNLENKKIILFCTSASTDITESADEIRNYNEKLNIIDAKRFSTSTDKEDVQKWIETL